MPRYHALDLDVRLKTCDFDESTTEDIVLGTNDETTQRIADVKSAFSDARVLSELPLPYMKDAAPMHFLGSNHNLPFYFVQVGTVKQSTSERVSSILASINKSRPAGATRSKTSTSTTPAPGLQQKALHICLSCPHATIRRVLQKRYTTTTSIRVEVFLNGHLAAATIISNKKLSDAPDVTFKISGRRIAKGHEKAWLLNATTEESRLDSLQVDNVRSRWNAISKSLQEQIKARVAVDGLKHQATTEFLDSLAYMKMPDCMEEFAVRSALKWSTLDVLVSVGDSNRHHHGGSYATEPAINPDLPDQLAHLENNIASVTSTLAAMTEGSTAGNVDTEGNMRVTRSAAAIASQYPPEHAQLSNAETGTSTGSRKFLKPKPRAFAAVVGTSPSKKQHASSPLQFVTNANSSSSGDNVQEPAQKRRKLDNVNKRLNYSDHSKTGDSDEPPQTPVPSEESEGGSTQTSPLSRYSLRASRPNANQISTGIILRLKPHATPKAAQSGSSIASSTQQPDNAPPKKRKRRRSPKPHERNLAFDIPELSKDAVLGYMADGSAEGDVRGCRQVARERQGCFRETAFVLGVRYVLGPGAGAD